MSLFLHSERMLFDPSERTFPFSSDSYLDSRSFGRPCPLYRSIDHRRRSLKPFCLAYRPLEPKSCAKELVQRLFKWPQSFIFTSMHGSLVFSPSSMSASLHAISRKSAYVSVFSGGPPR